MAKKIKSKKKLSKSATIKKNPKASTSLKRKKNKPSPKKTVKRRLISRVKKGLKPGSSQIKKRKSVPLKLLLPETAKFDISPAQKAEPVSGRKLSPDVLPWTYGDTKVVLMARDPFWAYAYWDFSSETWIYIKSLYEQYQQGLKSVLRIYDVTHDRGLSLNQIPYFDREVHFDTKNWYIQFPEADKEWMADLGLRDDYGNFIIIARSNRIRTPRNGPSERVDEAWMTEDFEEIFELSGGNMERGSGSERFIKKAKLFLEKNVTSPSVNVSSTKKKK